MKKILLTLFVGFVGIISFCSADLFKGSTSTYNVAGSYVWNNTLKYNWSLYKGYKCVLLSDAGIRCKVNGNNVYGGQSYTSPSSICVYNDVFNISCYSTDGNDHNFYVTSIDGVSCPECPECPTCDPQYTSEQCQSVYGLVSSGLLDNCQLDLNSCQSNTSGFNDLLNNCNSSLNSCNSSLTNCLQYNCPEIDYTGDLQFSNLYINDILHPGKQNIFVNIPDYITWDYNFTGDDFNLDVGSGYDVDYINSVIDINSYRPTSEDFTNVFVSGLTLVMPYIVIVLFIVFIRKLIKRIFK